MVNSDAGFGGPFSKSPGLLSPPYCTGTNSGLMNLRTNFKFQIIKLNRIITLKKKKNIERRNDYL